MTQGASPDPSAIARAWTPRRHDAASATARAYDVGLGGKDHYQTDKIAFNKLLKIAPLLAVAMGENRAFLGRGVTAVSLADTHQFLNLGSGLPSPDGISVLDVARRYHPDTRVVHVDVAELVAVHGRAMLAREDNVLMVHEDARDPKDVLKKAFDLLDPDEPAGIIATTLVHFWPDSDDPAGVLRYYMQEFPAGYLVLSHACGEEMPAEDFTQLRAAYEEAFAPIYPRTRAEVATLLEGAGRSGPGSGRGVQVARRPADRRREGVLPRGRRQVRHVLPSARGGRGMTANDTHRALSNETAQRLAANTESWCGGRWLVMWETWGQQFRAFPAYDPSVSTPVVGKSARAVWRRMLDVDQALLFIVAAAIPAHQPKAVRLPPGYPQGTVG